MTFLSSMRLRPSVSSPESSSFTTGSLTVSCVISPSAPPLSYVGGSSSSSVSDASTSSPPYVFSGIIASALPCRFLSLFLSRSSRRRFCFADLRRSLHSVKVSPLPSSSCSLTVNTSPSMPASRPAQRFTLLNASLACTPPDWRTSLVKRWRHTSQIPTSLNPGHLSRVIRRASMMAR